MKRAKKFSMKLSIFLSLALAAGTLAGCSNSSKGGNDPAGTQEGSAGTEEGGGTAADNSGADEDAAYTYTFASLDTPTTWNPHDAEIVEYITDYTQINLWNLSLNDTADGYAWIPEMASGEPEDITAEYAGVEEWGVPEGAEEGYAWKITLNPDAKWEDGTPINADSYIYSMQQLLSPEMNNYNASNYYTRLPIYNAEKYYKSKKGTAWDQVGLLKTGDYELTLILYNPLEPFFLKLYAEDLGLVNEELYEAGKSETGDMIKTNYGTSADTYMSFGPYKLVDFQADKEWHVARNENWYGWTDGEHDGYYQATDIVCSVVADSATQELLFLQGKLDNLVLMSDSVSKYQGSDYIMYYQSPYTYYLNINNDEKMLKTRQKESDSNKLILTYKDFRKGISLALNRSELVSQLGYGIPMYGYVSDLFVYDVDSGASYRDTEAAKETLKTFYGVTDVEEITGYDLDAARDCLVSGYEQALADGVVTETDVFAFEYPTWSSEVADLKEVNFLNDALQAATEGTVLEGRVSVSSVVSENLYDVLDSGDYDICMNAWNGSFYNPYDMMQYFVMEDYPQAYLGFDPGKETLDIEVDGNMETRTFFEWYDVLNNGEYALIDSESRSEIMAALELALLEQYRDCPAYSMSSASLCSMKINYATYDDVPGVGNGGIRGMTFNYTDAEWEQYCKDNNNQLNYN